MGRLQLQNGFSVVNDYCEMLKEIQKRVGADKATVEEGTKCPNAFRFLLNMKIGKKIHKIVIICT